MVEYTYHRARLMYTEKEGERERTERIGRAVKEVRNKSYPDHAFFRELGERIERRVGIDRSEQINKRGSTDCIIELIGPHWGLDILKQGLEDFVEIAGDPDIILNGSNWDICESVFRERDKTMKRPWYFFGPGKYILPR